MKKKREIISQPDDPLAEDPKQPGLYSGRSSPTAVDISPDISLEQRKRLEEVILHSALTVGEETTRFKSKFP
jgi:hypothetical protein